MNVRGLTVRELRAALTRLEELLEREGELLVLRRGRSIARLLPVGRKRVAPSHKRLRQEMPVMSEGSEVLVRRDRDDR